MFSRCRFCSTVTTCNKPKTSHCGPSRQDIWQRFLNVSILFLLFLLKKNKRKCKSTSIHPCLQQGDFIRRLIMPNFKPKVFTFPEDQYDWEVSPDSHSQS